MSGGYFNYDNSQIGLIARKIEEVVENNREHGFSQETLARFREAVKLLNKADLMVHRIDWLISCDDSEETFHKRLAEGLARLEKNQNA